MSLTRSFRLKHSKPGIAELLQVGWHNGIQTVVEESLMLSFRQTGSWLWTQRTQNYTTIYFSNVWEVNEKYVVWAENKRHWSNTYFMTMYFNSHFIYLFCFWKGIMKHMTLTLGMKYSRFFDSWRRYYLQEHLFLSVSFHFLFYKTCIHLL